MKKIAICDDNALQRELLAEILQAFYRRSCEKLDIMEYDCGEAVIMDVEEEEWEVDLLFLDIQMPGINGIETARRLRELECSTKIVFLTATADYALEGYDVQASGYLVKPVDQRKLCDLLQHIFWKTQRKRIEIKCGRQYRYPCCGDILYIESTNHRATIYLSDGSSINTIEKLSTLKERLDDPHFLQCHQSYLVNMQYIADIFKNVILQNGKEIPISVRRKKETIETYHRYFTEVMEE